MNCYILLLMSYCFSVHLSLAGTGRIYGKVESMDEEVYEGWIRWGKHETFWDDYLDATKKHYLENDWSEKKQIKIYGPFLTYQDKKKFRTNSMFGVRFGHLRKIIRQPDNKAIIEFIDGRRILVSGSNDRDIGSNNQGIEIDDQNFGKITLAWKSFKQVEFMKESSKYRKQQGNVPYRLYGIVETRNGDVFEGFTRWDDDECLSNDILNGKSRGRDLEIPFTNIKSIERDSKTTSRVELKNGVRITISGSNDIGAGNKGVVIKDKNFGELHIKWNDFEKIHFKERVTKNLLDYDDFKKTEPLKGKIRTRSNRIFKGYICWDNDEMFSSDVLDGHHRSFDINVEFCKIYSIEYHSRRSAMIELTNGSRFKISGSNDVDHRNMGIYIMDQKGESQKLNWEDFDKVIFSH